MKLFKRILLVGTAFATLVAIEGAVSKYNAFLVNEKVAYSKVYPLSLNNYSLQNLSFQATASSVTFSAATFTDGQASTGSITVVSNTALSTAAASNYVQVLTTQPVASGSYLNVNGTRLYFGVQIFQDLTSTNTTAISIKQGINAYVPGIHASTGVVGGFATVFSTFTGAGSYGNNGALTSNTSSVTVHAALYAGGLDGARVQIGNKSYVANLDFTVGSSTNVTGLNLANAINAVSATYHVVASTGVGATGTVVFTTSTIVGSIANYAMFSSTQAALKLNSPVTTTNGTGAGAMTGGANPSFRLAGGTTKFISLPSHGFPRALPVLYVGATAITGLATGTTYYIIPVTPNAVSLAATSTGAVAGVALALSSTKIKTTADSYTLTPLAIAGTPSYKWRASNDCANYFDMAVSSVTLSSYVSTGTVNSWDFGRLNYACVELDVTAPTAGAITLSVIGNGN